jgi:hypothetical protein
MEGQDIVPALQNGVLMTALHTMGYQKGVIDPKTQIGGDEAYKMAATTFDQYGLGDVVPTVKKGEAVPQILKLQPEVIDKLKADYKTAHPNDTRFDNLSNTDSGAAINLMGRNARQQFIDIVTKGGSTVSPEDIKKETTRITVAENQLFNQTLDPTTRAQKEMKDLLSMGEKLRPQITSAQLRSATSKNDILGKISATIPDVEYPNPNNQTFPTGKGGITGYGLDSTPDEKANVDDFAKNPKKYDGKIYIPKTDSETASIMRLVAQEQIANPKLYPEGATITNPDQVLRAFIRTTDGQFKPVGYIPEERSFDTKTNNLNKTYYERLGRFQKIISAAKSPEDVQRLAAKDKAGVNLTLDQAKEIFDGYRTGKMTNEQLYDALNPENEYEKLDSKLNNSAIWQKMDELGLNYLTVDPYKVWEANGSRPRYNPKNPYLNVGFTDQDWLRSIALKDILPEEKPTTQAPTTATPAPVSEPTTQEMSNAISSLVNKEATPATVSAETKPALSLTINEERELRKQGYTNEQIAWMRNGQNGPMPEKATPGALTVAEIKNMRKQGYPENLIQQAIAKSKELPLAAPVPAPKAPVEAPKAVETTKVSTPVETPVVEDTNVKGETQKEDNILDNYNFEKEKSKPVSPRDIRSELDGVNNATRKVVDKKLSGLDPESQEAKDLIAFRDAFTKNNLTTAANEALTEAGDEIKGADTFIKRISESFTSRGLEDPTEGYKNQQSYKKLFRDSVLDKPSLVFRVSGNGGFKTEYANAKQPRSFVEETLGLPQVYYEENKNLPAKDRPSEQDKQDYLLNSGFVPFYYDNKPGSLLGIKFNSEMAGGKKMTDPGALGDFTTALAKKLGFDIDKDTVNSFAKRLKSLNSQEQVNPIKGETWTHYIIKSDSGINKTVAETTPNWNDVKVNDVVTNKDKVKTDLGEKKSIDGTQYTSPENIARMAEGAGFVHTPDYIKPTHSFIDPETGNLFHQKLEMRAYTPEEKAKFEQALGRELTPSDVVTFEDNVKLGYGRVGEDKGKYWEVQAPSESYRFKYNDPHEPTGSISIGGIMTKIPAEARITEAIGQKYKTYADNLRTLSSEIQNSHGAQDIEQIWKKHTEFYKDQWMDNLYGDLKESAKNGAGLTQLGKTVNTEINKIITETYANGEFLNGDNLHIRPDTGFKTDPKTGEKTYLDSGELMISKKTFTHLYGKDAYKELQGGKEFNVLAFRYPTLKDTSVAKMRVLVGEDHGTKIGDSQVVTNSADTMKFDHDTDGDGLQMFAIGGEKGVPPEMADYFESKQGQGDMIFPNLEKTAKIPLKGGDLYEKLMKYSEQNLKGGEAIGTAAASVRPMRFLASNNYVMKVGPASSNGQGFRTVEHLLNGKVIETTKVPESIRGKSQFPKSAKTGFEVRPTFGDKESYMIGQIGQEAVDSVGTTDLIKRFKDHGGDASTYITEKLFSGAHDAGTKAALRGFVDQLQAPYKLNKATAGDRVAMSTLQPYIDLIKKIKEDGGSLGPVEQIALNLDGLKPIDYFKNDSVTQRAVDAAGVKNVRTTFGDEIQKITNHPSPALSKWKNIWSQIKNSKSGQGKVGEVKNQGSIAWEQFKKNNKLNAADKKEIAIWSATAPEANLAWTNGRLIVRPTFITNDSPEVAKALFSGENMFKKTEAKPDGAGGLLPSFFSGVQNFFNPTLSYTAPTSTISSLNSPKFLKAIGTNETSVVKGNKYTSSQLSGYKNLGKALGKYRVTEGELKSYATRYLGRPVTKQEFLNSPTLQDTYMTKKAEYLSKQGYTPQEIADIHNKGMTNSFPAGSGEYQNPDYVSKFNSVYNTPD